MNRCIVLLAAMFLAALVTVGCSGGGSPVAPQSNDPGITTGSSYSGQTQTHLWGYYTVYMDMESQAVKVVPDRNVMFTANVVNFLNIDPLSLQFKINEIIQGTGYIDVDIDVGITHPFPGLPHYNGYDVRGIFMGDGSEHLWTCFECFYAVLGESQFMLADPDDGIGGPDGYTRWFNKAEFSEGGMPLFSYTQGNFASPGFAGTATLNPYKYFADGLGAEEDLWSWLNDQSDQNGIFSSGATNERNYYLRFPTPVPGTVYGYAVIANWEGVEEENHPSNAPEAVGCDVEDLSDVWYVDETTNGGSINLDISLFGWNGNPSTIRIESTVLSVPYELDTTEMIPIGGDENFSTWHVEIPADNISGVDGNEYWVLPEYCGFNYKNDFGTVNWAWNDPLTAFFRFDLDVSGGAGNLPPECSVDVVTSMPVSGWGFVEVEFDATDSSDPEGGPVTFEWDFDDDGVFGDSFEDGTDSNPIKTFTFTNQTQVCVRVTDEEDESSECCVDVDIEVFSSKNIPLREDEIAADLALEPNGDLLIVYDDGQVWRYTESAYYSQSGAAYVFTGLVIPLTGNAQLTNAFIDVDPNGNMIVSAASGACDPEHGWPAQNFDSSGNPLGSAPSGCTAGPVPDVVACKSGGSYAYCHFVMAPYNSASNYQNNMYRKYNPFTGASWTQNYGPGPFSSPQTGYDGIWLGYVKGAEAIDGQRFWVVKDPDNPSIQDYYGSRWDQSTYFYYYYDDAWFGTGSQTDDDDGWNGAKDLTMDSDGRLFVLDELSTGDPRVKVWSVDVNDTTSIGGFGNSTSISSPPLRIEGGDYNGNIFVLHGDDTDGYFLSVFFPPEMPG